MLEKLKGENPIERLFSYGSLQPGEPNEHILAMIEGEWQPATIKGVLYESGWGADIGYPGLVLDEAGDDIRGQLLTDPDLSQHWQTLDEFEGREYERVITDVTLSSGERVKAYVYEIRDKSGLID